VWCSTTRSPESVCGAAADEFVAYNAVAQAVMDWSFGVVTNDLYAHSLPRLTGLLTQGVLGSHNHDLCTPPRTPWLLSI
jgi:hypothetical protein